MVAMATNSNITVPQKYTAKYKNVGYGWDTSHPTTISKKFIILIYHYFHAVSRVSRIDSHFFSPYWPRPARSVSRRRKGQHPHPGVVPRPCTWCHGPFPGHCIRCRSCHVDDGRVIRFELD